MVKNKDTLAEKQAQEEAALAESKR